MLAFAVEGAIIAGDDGCVSGVVDGLMLPVVGIDRYDAAFIGGGAATTITGVSRVSPGMTPIARS